MSTRGSRGRRGAQPTYTDAVLFVRELRQHLDDPKYASIELSYEEIALVFMMIDSLIPGEDDEATP